MPRFVVLRHDCPESYGRGLHWDLMLEVGDALRTWALADEPGTGPVACCAEHLPDHRLLYLDYEGEVSGGRGTVTRLDAGDYLVKQNDDRAVAVELNGTRLRGTATLLPPGEDDQRWRFLFVPEGTAASGFSAGPAAGIPPDSRGTVSPAIKTSSSPS